MNSHLPTRVESPPVSDNHYDPTPTAKPRRTLLTAVAITVLVFVVSSAADLILLYEHAPARRTVEVSDGIASIIIGLLSYRLLVIQRQRREELRKRVETIADMNHHVRNALQVISLASHGKSQEEIATIRESVSRIQWALRELLPKI
jgi:hypothetical protein